MKDKTPSLQKKKKEKTKRQIKRETSQNGNAQD